MDKDDDQPIDLGWLMKAGIGFIGSILTAAILSIWATVNSTNIEVVRLQSRVVALEQRIELNGGSYNEKIQIINNRLDLLESRLLHKAN